MTGYNRAANSAHLGNRRKLRLERAQERKLVLRNRWYAGGVATVISAALVFTGVSSPALAETVPAPDATTQTTTPPADETATPPADDTATPAPTDEATPPAEEAPAEEAPAAEPLTNKSTEAPAPLAEISPMSVPAPGAGQAVITVKVGSDRTGITGVTNLGGVVLLLNTGSGSPSGTRPDGVAGAGDGWAKCVSDPQGDCSFVVPDTQAGDWWNGIAAGKNRDARFWVVQSSVPTGYYTNPSLRTGGASGAGDSTAYRFRTGDRLRAGSTYSSQDSDDFMLSSGSSADASGGIWQQSRSNPTLQASCGLDVALILDLSGSVGNTTNLKTAANTFVNSLQGTPSRMSLFSFAWQTPAGGASQNFPNLTSVSTTDQATAFKSRYATWTSDGGTNWDRGLGTAASSNTGANTFDVAVIITDGNPTTYNQPYQGSGSNNRFRETENGIFSANALKAAGTRVLAFGVGDGATGTTNGLNLRAISGPTAYTGSNGATADFYQTSDYAAVGTALRNLALGNCQGTLNVTKQIVPESAPAGSITGAAAAGAGWQFTSVMNTAGVTTPTAVRTTTADGTGTVSYPMTFSGKTSGSVTVTEAQQSGFVLQPVDGKNAVCTNLNTGAAVIPSANVTNGFTVDVPSTETVNCTVYNRAPSSEADITVTKKWTVNGKAYANGAQPSDLGAQLQLTGPGSDEATDQGWGVTRTGFQVNAQTKLFETVDLVDPTMCNNNAIITEINGETRSLQFDQGYPITLSKVHNTVTILNEVTCESRLTLIKSVRGGDASPQLWTLKALNDAGFSGKSGAPAVTNVKVIPDARYGLAESGGDPLYVQTDNRTDLQSNPGSTGSATCIRVDANGAPWADSGYSDGINGGVNVPLGYRVACTFVNETAELTLLKHVVNDNGGTAAASAWELTAKPVKSTAVPTNTVTGSETIVPASTFQVRPGQVYELSESGKTGYAFSKLQAFVDGIWVDVVADPTGYPTKNDSGNWEIIVGAQGSPVYRFVNDDIAPRLTLVKVVTNDHGGKAKETDWTLTATTPNGPNLSGKTETASVTDQPVKAGVAYTIGENGGPTTYALDYLRCDKSDATTAASPTVTLDLGDDVTCVLHNDDKPGLLTLVKEVDNTHGGTAVPTDWTLSAAGPTAVSGKSGKSEVTAAPVKAGVYTITESGGPANYEQTNLVCSTPITDGTITITNGQSVTCTFTNTSQIDDVEIEKTTSGVEGPVESGDSFTYVLKVTNNGTRVAKDVKVSDPIPARLTVTGIDLADAEGWTNDNAPALVGANNTVALSAPTLAVGASVEIRVAVTVNAVASPAIPNLDADDPVPTPAPPVSTLVNEACVSAAVDTDLTNNCDSVTVDLKDISAILYTRCVGDAALIGFSLAKSETLTDLPVSFVWTPNAVTPTTAPASVAKAYAGGTSTVFAEFPWVGTAFTPSGVSLDYPGWRPLQASDYAPGGGYFVPGTTDVMTPAQQESDVFNGLILDSSELDYAWRGATTVKLSVNPEMTFTLEYPPATPECFVARHTEVQIEKTASATKTGPGKSFTYTLAAANVSDDSAADGVVVTDTIPADLKITDVSWTGKGDANVFPNWSSCAVAGQDGSGYGGTLTCELFGPLQPAGSGLGTSAAPTITLSATVNASSKASVITNVGVVDYYTFGDPTDTGRDADDAVVLLSGLPATGGSALTPLILLGFLALLGGTMTVFMIRRRRGDAKPQL
ncbi:VWA domain-containing protein [Microbacterium sp. Root61]|uniref:VWA domain-containing protein n=1 Tax=Microbacterium sp. Root61 TaxID=1736570 RepID=UPI000AB9B5BC|nr:VWA domain-containing protein [Microbacterium sp. Root61]